MEAKTLDGSLRFDVIRKGLLQSKAPIEAANWIDIKYATDKIPLMQIANSISVSMLSLFQL